MLSGEDCWTSKETRHIFKNQGWFFNVMRGKDVFLRYLEPHVLNAVCMSALCQPFSATHLAVGFNKEDGRSMIGLGDWQQLFHQSQCHGRSWCTSRSILIFHFPRSCEMGWVSDCGQEMRELGRFVASKLESSRQDGILSDVDIHPKWITPPTDMSQTLRSSTFFLDLDNVTMTWSFPTFRIDRFSDGFGWSQCAEFR